MSATMTGTAGAPLTGSDGRTNTTPLIHRQLDLTGRSILFATDGSPCSIAAARVAQALAREHHAVVHVLSVVDNRSAPIPPPLDIALAMGDALVGPEVHKAQEAAVRSELSGALDERIEWPIRIMLGTPAAAIVQEARHIDAVLIVVGLRRHGKLDRARHDETTLNIMRTAGCAVLGVSAEQSELPTRILGAVDFSAGSLAALRAGRAVAGKDATMVLAYVKPMHGFLEDEGEAMVHQMGVQAGFAKLAHDLGGQGSRFDHVVLHNAPPESVGEALLEYAEDLRCDLVTAGSVQHSRIDRWMVGSVSTELVRDGRRSVLIVPPLRQG